MAETVKIVDLDIDEKDLLKKLTKLQGEITKLKDESKKLETANKDLDKAGKKNTTQYKENSKQIEINKINTKGLSTEYRNNQNVLVNLNATESKQLGTLQQLELSNKKLREESKKLDLTRKSGQDRLKVINKQLDQNNETILKNADATKAQKMNIGAYGSALGGLGGPLAAATRGVQMLTAAFKFLLLNPIGLILVAVAGAVKMVGSAIKSNQGVLDKFKASADGIRAAWSSVTDRLNDLGETVKKTGKLNWKIIKDSFKGLTDEIDREFEAAKRLKEEFIALQDVLIDQTVQRAKLQQIVQMNRLAVKDENMTNRERLALLDEAIAAENELIALELGEAEERARILSEQVGLGRSLREEMKAEQEALAKIIQVETDGAKRKIRLASERLSLARMVAKEDVKIAEASALIAAKAVDNEIQLERIKSITINEIKDGDVEGEIARSQTLKFVHEDAAEHEMTLADLTAENKLDLAQNFLKDITTTFGKGSAIGKAAAVAETTINTFRAAQNAFTSLSGIPVIGVPLGIAAAGAATAMGLANVKKILAVKTPGGGGGGGISGGGGRASISIGSSLGRNYAAGAPADGGTTTSGITDSAAAAIKQGMSEALKESPPVLVIEDVTRKQMQQDSVSKVTTV